MTLRRRADNSKAGGRSSLAHTYGPLLATADEVSTRKAAMKAPVFVAACAVLATFVSISSPSIAQQKTVKQCQDEWRANKAENRAKEIKEKDYVAQCRAETAATPQTAPVPQATPAPPPPSAGRKTAKECRAEWQANKADNQAKGITEKQYVEQCRTGGAAPAATPTPAPARTAPGTLSPLRRRPQRPRPVVWANIGRRPKQRAIALRIPSYGST
jgi:hypothetical protein